MNYNLYCLLDKTTGLPLALDLSDSSLDGEIINGEIDYRCTFTLTPLKSHNTDVIFVQEKEVLLDLLNKRYLRYHNYSIHLPSGWDVIMHPLQLDYDPNQLSLDL